MTEKLGKAGRFYSLTPKAYKFIRALEKWCAERGIDKDDILKLLQHASRERVLQNATLRRSLKATLRRRRAQIESLVEKGYFEEEARA